MAARLAYWTCFAAALAVYGTMVVWTLPGIAAEAGGLAAFDMRPTGYSAEEARAFLAALTTRGLALYTGPQRWLDLVYPALLAVVLAGGTRALFPRGLLAIVVIGCVIGGMGADYLENMRVAALLAGEHSDASIAAASQATVFKSALTSVAMIAILMRLLHVSFRKWTNR